MAIFYNNLDLINYSILFKIKWIWPIILIWCKRVSSVISIAINQQLCIQWNKLELYLNNIIDNKISNHSLINLLNCLFIQKNNNNLMKSLKNKLDQWYKR